MNREVAIHNLFALELRTREPSDRVALKMAIEALKQEPKTGIDWITEENPEDADAYLVTWEHPRYKGSRFIGICEWDGTRWIVEDMEQAKLYKDTLIIKAWNDPEPYRGDVE